MKEDKGVSMIICACSKIGKLECYNEIELICDIHFTVIELHGCTC